MSSKANAASVVTALTILVGACGTAAPSASPEASPSPRSAPADSAAASPSMDPWAADLATLDESVRRLHPAPFTIHSEAEWNAKLVELRASLPSASQDEQLVQLASLVGLLDTHSYLEWPTGASFYEVVLYPFSDGVFVVRAGDPGLVGARLVSIGGVPVDEVRKRLAPHVPHDKASGLLDGIEACSRRSSSSTGPPSSRIERSRNSRSSEPVVRPSSSIPKHSIWPAGRRSSPSSATFSATHPKPSRGERSRSGGASKRPSA